MAGFGKLALAALAASLLPYEVKKDDNGELTYKSLLLGVKTKTAELLQPARLHEEHRPRG